MPDNNKKTIIFSDFDGSFSQKDIGHRIFRHFSNGGIIPLVEQWKKGEISSRECLRREAGMIHPTYEEIYDFLSEFRLADGAIEFYRTIKSRGIPFFIVSDGTDIYIDHILKKYDLDEIKYFCNIGKIENRTLSLDFIYDNNGCQRCGCCKGARINDLVGSSRSEWEVIFIGDGIKEEIFGNNEAIGETVFIQGTGFTVIGVLRPKLQSSSYGSGLDDRIAYIPASTMTSVFGQKYINNFVYRARDPRQQFLVTQRVYQVLARICGFDPADTETLYLWDSSDLNKLIFFFFLGFNMLLGLCGVFTLLVGGIAVANIMYLLVGQKTGEIGIQIAVGAKRRHILAQFLLQALVLVTAGGLAGFLISWILITIMNIVPLPEQIGVPEMSLIVCLVTVVLLGAIGLLAGYFPAKRAASLDPVRSLGFGGL